VGSVIYSSFALAVCAKIVMGAGFDPLIIAGRIILTKWFFGRELGFASNLNLATSRIMVFINGVLTPTLADNYGISVAFTAGLCLCLMSFISTYFILRLHK
jgi:hypothetical protein